MSQGKELLTKTEFEGWAGEIKESFNRVEERLDAIDKTLDQHTTILSEIAGTLRDIRTELKSVTGLYRRLDRRTEALADHVHLDLHKVDAAV